MSRVVKIGTRGSRLARTQAEEVAAKLRGLESDLEVEIVTVKTRGDIIQDVPLSQVKGQGFFVKELESAMTQGEVDLAVHSAKDLPTQLPEGMALAAILEREDPRDCLISRSGQGLDELPQGASVATSALRRQALIAAERPDLERRELRGNVDTRLRKLDEGQFDAMIVARAALHRLGYLDRITETIALERFVPAVAQGALALEVRAEDQELTALLGRLAHPMTTAAVRAERVLLETTQGGCQIPLGAHCRPQADGRLYLHACVVAPDGSQRIDAEGVGEIDDPSALGLTVAREVLDRGGREVLEQVRRG